MQLLLREADSMKTATNFFPRAVENNRLVLVKSRDWTSGFFAGELWMLYAYTHKAAWKASAEKYTALMAREQYNNDSHDVGFKVYCSYGNGYLQTKDTAYKNTLVRAARTLAKRFNPKTGVIRSWDFNKETWQYPVIIDNMMNLELLFAATRLSGDSSFYKIADSHARQTMRNHFRKDFSSYHVVDYDTLSGLPRHKQTHQGYADESAWARGQGWALYGFTLCYRETKNPAYLQMADSIAQYILHNPALPADKVPYWDYDVAGKPGEPRDASAAAVVASALYELSGYSKLGKYYRSSADTIINNLTRYYRAKPGEAQGFILLHSTGNKPANGEVDVPIIYGDYYYLEAVLRSGKK